MAALDRKMAAAVPVLAQGGTHAEAAKAAGVSERTLRRWLDNPDFAAAIAATQEAASKTAVQLLAEYATHAAQRLHELVDSDSEMIALGACRAILQHTVPTKVESSGGVSIRHEVIGADPDLL